MKISIQSICHFIAGMIATLATQIPNGYVVTTTLTLTFIMYEVIEQLNLGAMEWKDPAHEEILEYMIGMATCTVLIFIWMLK